MYKWGRFVHRFRWVVLVLSLVGGFLAAGFGAGVMAPNVLKQGGFEDPGASSTSVYKAAATVFGAANPHVMLVYRSPDLQVSDPRYQKAILETVARLPKAYVKSYLSYWHISGDLAQAKDARKNIVSDDGKSTFIALVLQGADDNERLANFTKIEHSFAVPGMDVKVGGGIPIGRDFADQMAADLKRAELISLPAVVIIGLFVFGSAVAAVMPMFVGVFSIIGALAVLRAITMITDVSNFGLTLVTMLSVGLAIDYSLFIISRYREELGRGHDRETAMGVTMATAGRTVAFSAVTVAVSMSGLLMFPQMFLRSIGLSGMAVILVALTTSLVMLPAMLAVVGKRLEFLRMPWLRKNKARMKEESGLWYRLAQSVMNRPIIYFLGVSALLLACVAPFFHVQFGAADIRALPKEMPTRIVVETIERDFSSGVMDPIDVLIEGNIIPKNYKPGKTPIPPYLEKFRVDVGKLPGAESAQFLGYNEEFGAVRMQVTFDGATHSEQTKELVRKIRALQPPGDVAYISVGGATALQMDMMETLVRTLPKMAVFVGVAIFILLFAAFGSLVLPIKAIIMNLLSIGSSFGAIVWAFQDGHLAGVLDFTVTGSVDANSMILILAIVFGLSMDYEVFLLSRIKEEWDRTHDNRAAVAAGLQRTGGIITSAAVLLILVVAAFSTAEVAVVKLIGVGLLVAVIVDATLVRSLLVPATMRFMGNANWWLPGPLKKLHAMIDLGEVHEVDVSPPVRMKKPPAPSVRTVAPVASGYAWSHNGQGTSTGQSVIRREIVANPDGPGWKWREVEDEYA